MENYKRPSDFALSLRGCSISRMAYNLCQSVLTLHRIEVIGQVDLKRDIQCLHLARDSFLPFKRKESERLRTRKVFL